MCSVSCVLALPGPLPCVHHLSSVPDTRPWRSPTSLALPRKHMDSIPSCGALSSPLSPHSNPCRSSMRLLGWLFNGHLPPIHSRAPSPSCQCLCEIRHGQTLAALGRTFQLFFEIFSQRLKKCIKQLDIHLSSSPRLLSHSVIRTSTQ